MHNFTFSNNDNMPAFGLGTWKSAPGEVKAAVIDALEIGYRHLDCAAIYGNESEVGEGIAESIQKGVLQREELWVTSKLWNNAHQEAATQPALEKTLSDLGLDYLDLYLIHWPVAFKPDVVFPENEDGYLPLADAPITETWGGMQALKTKGLARHIGVSNFSIKKLKELMTMGGQIPEMNQVELHPYLQQQALVDFCLKNGIHVTAYSPLGSMDRPEGMKKDGEPVPLENEAIKKIAAAHNASPAQILIAWALQRGTSVIPKSTNPKRLQQNFEAQEIILTDDEMDLILGQEKAERIVDGTFFNAESKGYTIANLWDD